MIAFSFNELRTDRKHSLRRRHTHNRWKFLMRWQKCKFTLCFDGTIRLFNFFYRSVCLLSSHSVADLSKSKQNSGKKKMNKKKEIKFRTLQIYTMYALCGEQSEIDGQPKHDSSWFSTLPEWHEFCLLYSTRFESVRAQFHAVSYLILCDQDHKLSNSTAATDADAAAVRHDRVRLLRILSSNRRIPATIDKATKFKMLINSAVCERLTDNTASLLLLLAFLLSFLFHEFHQFIANVFTYSKYECLDSQNCGRQKIVSNRLQLTTRQRAHVLYFWTENYASRNFLFFFFV